MEIEGIDDEDTHQHNHGDNIFAEGNKLQVCKDCNSLHGPGDGCIGCGASLFGDEKFCPECGQDQSDADGTCTDCGRGLLSSAAVAGDDDYSCPHCDKGGEEGVKFAFKSDELKTKFLAAQKAAAATKKA